MQQLDSSYHLSKAFLLSRCFCGFDDGDHGHDDDGDDEDDDENDDDDGDDDDEEDEDGGSCCYASRLLSLLAPAAANTLVYCCPVPHPRIPCSLLP